MRPSRSLVALLGLLAVLFAGLAVAAPAHAGDTDIKINEVESNGGSPGDWVELVNTGTASIDLSGWVIKDNDDTHVFTIPSGTSLGAGARQAFDVDPSFGLGAADTARVFPPSASAPVDSYSWTAHATTTYGRCPDGAGAFATTTASTKGTANACATPVSTVKLNEVESNGGSPGDWIELYNTGTEPVDISGLKVKDADDTHAFSVIPSGTTIAAGGYHVVEEAALGFGLGSADSARLFDTDGSTLLDSYAWTAHAATTYGRCPNGVGVFGTTTSSTKGAANACPAPSAAIKINELSSNNPDFIELINTGASTVDLTGWVLKDNTDSNSYTFPAGSSIAAGAIKGVSGESVEFAFGLGNGDAARLFAPGGIEMDSYTYPAHPPAGKSYGRCPDGTGSFVVTNSATKGAANDCAVGIPNVKINEIESNGDQVADWVELKNTGSASADVSGWKILDNDPAHVGTPVVVPANTIIPAGGYYALYTEIAQSPGFGLGGADSATLYLPDGATQVDTYSWTAHAATTYGRCPDGTGSFVTTTTSTRGLANACNAIRLNEIESDDPAGDDWIELKNVSTGFASITGWKLRDVASGTTYPIPALGVAGGGHVLLDRTAFGFDMTGSDTLQLLDDTSTVVESYTWAVHATQSYGRCKDGVGNFTDTKAPTPGATNSCPGLETLPWPGSQTVATADLAATFLQDLSGLAFDPADPDVLWAAQNKKGTLFKLVRDASNNWVPAGGWPRDPKFPGGTGAPDTEGLTIGPEGSVYLASERNNAASGVSRMSILRYDPNAPAGATIEPTAEWNLTSLIPAAGANLGLEGVAFVPDSYLIGNGFKDQSTGTAYDPASYPGHGSGLFFVAVEDTGDLIAFALDDDGTTAHKIATIDSGFEHLADVSYDPERGRVWAVTDDTHDGRTSLLKIDAAGAFVVDKAYDRPAGMPNMNNEGLAIAPQSRCVGGLKEVVWSDDGDTGGHSLRRGAISCTAPAAQTVTFTSTPPASPVVGQTYTPTATGGGSGNPVMIAIADASASVCSLSSSVVRFDHPGTCTIVAIQAAAQGYLAGSASQDVVVGKAPITVTTKSTSGLLSLLTFRITYTSTVKSAVTGLPVAGVPVTTKINNGAASTGCTATTNASGVATCTAGPINIALWAPFTATAAATANHLGGTASGIIGLL